MGTLVTIDFLLTPSIGARHRARGGPLRLCTRLGAVPAGVLSARRRPAECAARAGLAFVACDGAGLTGAELAESLGVSRMAVSAARGLGRALLTERGWTTDEVLSWHASAR
jgi:hypothetical protein